MKKIFFSFLVAFPLAAISQMPVVIKRKINGSLCDTCQSEATFNSENPVSYVIAGAKNMNVSQDSSLYQNSGQGLQNVSKHFTAYRNFSIDFLPNYIIRNGKRIQIWKKPDATQPYYAQLQFKTFQNGQAINDWTNINSLPGDKEFYTGLEALEQGGDKPIRIDWENYHTGPFNLNISDSLILFLRDNITKKTVQTIYVKRLPAVPQYFILTQFPATKSLQDILNVELRKNYKRNDTTDMFEVDAGNICLLQFGAYPTEGDLEYAFAEKPNAWQTINIGIFLSSGYIVINNTEPGKEIELLLRYKFQPESIRRIKIKVKPKIVQTAWFKIAASLVLAFCLFGIWYYFKRRKHKKQLLEITRKKEDIENKLQLLSSQLNPHFLFNSLNAIQGLINKNDTERANSYVTEVATFMRTIMDTGKREFVSLQEELLLEEKYIQLEQQRKSFRYTINNHCSFDLSKIEFPPLLLQPVIENSIRHGFGKEIPSPFLSLDINCSSRDLTIIIRDNGTGFNREFLMEGHGLSLIKKRIALMNEKLKPMKIDMSVQTETGKGTTTLFTFKNWLQ